MRTPHPSAPSAADSRTTAATSATPVDIRLAQAADHALLFRLLQLYYFEATRWSGEDLQADGLYESCEEALRDYLGGGKERALIARVDGHPAGFALIEPAHGFDRGIQELADLFVLPKYRRRGLALALLEHAMQGSTQPWLVANFREDTEAQAFRRHLAARLPSCSIRQLPDDPDSRCLLFLLNEAPTSAR